jgi:peptide/nickel transport system substrate-binding protein
VSNVSKGEIDRRALLRSSAYLGGGLLLFGGCTASSGGSNVESTSLGPGGRSRLPAIEGGEIITDRARFPASFKESPEFAKSVVEGKLPAVADRIGQDPLVIKPVHEIGKYGGVLRRAYNGPADQASAFRSCAGPDSLLYWDYRQENVRPNIARDFELSPDFTQLTVHLRRGMKWSDGHPFTADDILFWRNDISFDPALGAGAVSLRSRGQDVVVEKIDELTVNYRSRAPYAALPELMASFSDIGGLAGSGSVGGGGYAPKHYLSQFLPKYTSEAKANASARAAGFGGWALFFLDRFTWVLNPDLPALTPWMVTRPGNTPPLELAANPYSIWVDTDGNQLPYIPKITMSAAKDPDVISLRAVSGQYDFQDRGLQVDKMPVLIQNQKRSDYTIHRAPGDSIDCGIRINLAYNKDPALGELIRNVDFRRALALGINRDQINQTFFLGSAVPSAVLPAETSPYHPGVEWRQKWATRDVRQANELLDKIGLAEKDAQGFRLRPSDGKRLRLNIQSAPVFTNYPAVAEMVKKHWTEIGVDVTNQTVNGALLLQRVLSNELMMTVNAVVTDDLFTLPEAIVPTNTNSFGGMMGIPYAKWFASDGKVGTEPPASVGLLKQAIELYRRGLEVDRAERASIGQQLFKMHADQAWSIGIVGFGLTVNGLYYAKNNLGNVPARIRNNTPQKSPSNALPMTFYFK